MNTKTQARRIVAVLLIICISIGGGMLINELWNVLDRKLHPVNYEEIIANASEEFDIPKYIIYSVIKVESGFDPDAISRASAMGLMQMTSIAVAQVNEVLGLPETANLTKMYDPEFNIRYGTCYLSYLYKKFDYNWNTTFAAYNAGEGNVATWLRDPKYSDLEGNLIDFPDDFGETRHYVKKVNKAIETYKELYPEITEMN